MITGIIMASGFSKRMGENKLLLDIEGKKIIEHVINAIKGSKIDEILLIYRDDKLCEIGKRYGVKCIYNPGAEEGQSQSVIVGVENAKEGSYMFFAGDQPFITSDIINKLVERHKENNQKIVLPIHCGKISTPIIFPAKYRQELLKIEGDKGGREIIRDNPKDVEKLIISDKKSLIDIDNFQEYRHWTSSQL